MNLSVVILTLNEEVNLPGCLEALTWCDDVVVYDSFSTDATEQIARDAGARFIQRRFDNYANQRNAALHEVEYQHDWVVMVDADERWDADLAGSIDQAATEAAENVTIFSLRRKDMFMGRWLRRSSAYPTWFPRVCRPRQVNWQREINEELHSEGRTKLLKGHFIHYPFNKGVGWWFNRHNRYSTMEAQRLIEEVRQPVPWGDLLRREPGARRRALKRLAFKLPFRPSLVFIYLYLVRLGFLDGRAGLTYCRLRAFYEYMIDLKVKEIRRREQSLPI